MWNNGEPVWNKGKAMKPPLECTCCHCGGEMLLPSGSGASRNARYRLRKGLPAYCSPVCSRSAKGAKISKSLMGQKPSDSTKAAMLEGIMRFWADPDNKAKMIAIHTGRKYGPDTLERKRLIGKTSQKAIAQRAKMHAKFKGPNSPHWKGGITPINVMERNSVAGRTWKQAVKERDDYTCQLCGKRGGELHSDHIKPFSTHPDLRWEMSNGRTLCRDCHRATPTYGRFKREVFAL